MAQYLNAALDDGDPALFVAAIVDIAKAKGMMEISKKSGWREGFVQGAQVGLSATIRDYRKSDSCLWHEAYCA